MPTFMDRGTSRTERNRSTAGPRKAVWKTLRNEARVRMEVTMATTATSGCTAKEDS